jgi:hypothetical protein
MSHGIDVDYTAAINFLAEYGFDELLKVGFSTSLLERLDSKAALDETTKKAISSDWLERKMPNLSAGNEGLGARDIRGKVARAAQPHLPAQAKLKAVQARCVKCKASRQIGDPRVVTLKNGKQAIQGVCPVCGSTLIRFGIPH